MAFCSVSHVVQSSPGPLFATKISSNGHYLLDQNGNPHLMVVASEQTWTNISVTAMQSVMQTRAEQGFNWEQLIVIANQGYDNATGSPDWSTYDGIVPFYQSDGITLGTGPANYDVTQPYEPYWQRIDAVFRAAQANGITLLVSILGDAVYQTSTGFYAAQGNTKLATYATWFANRYKGFTYHHLWGYDHFTTISGGWASPDPHISVMINAVQSANSKPLHTIENNDALWTTGATSGAAVDLASDDTNFTSGPGNQMTLNACYTAEDNSPDILRGYQISPAMPTFFAEGVYDGSSATGFPTNKNGWSNLLNRKYLWYPMVNGACGSSYGHATVWAFSSGYAAALSTTPVAHVGIWRAFMQSYAWWNLVPDSANTFVTVGFPSTGNPYSTRVGLNAAVTADGSLGLVYLAANQSVTVAMSKMRGTTIARWFDPTDGCYSAIGSFSNSGSHTFTSSTNNAGGDPDWVLVLTA